jgi:molybdopterin molybdotransferase
MVNASEALEIVESLCSTGSIRSVSLTKAYGQILAEDVPSPIAMPPFRQSSMDGYAINQTTELQYKLIGEVQAGETGDFELKPGDAVRIFTGARVPDSANTVVVQEDAKKEGETVSFLKLPAQGANVRAKGEQINAGDIALEKGTLLNEATLSFLAGLGLTRVSVFDWPKVTIIVTGNELQKPGVKLKPGQIYESNALLLEMALYGMGIRKVTVTKVKDSLEDTIAVIDRALRSSDLVLISGGISVGEYDYVKDALAKNEVEELFYKVNQKPGKPLWVGKKDQKVVYALPGNPASTLSCFYLYVLPFVRARLGHSEFHLPRVEASLSSSVANPQGKTLFLKGKLINGRVEVLSGQASSMLRSFSDANVLIIIPENKAQMNKGEKVWCIRIK